MAGTRILYNRPRYRSVEPERTTLQDTEGDPMALARVLNSSQGRRRGTTPAERAGAVEGYRPGYGFSSPQNRDTGTSNAFDSGFFNSAKSWDAAYPKTAPVRAPENLLPPAPTQVRYRSPGSVVIPANANATDAQRDASIAENLKRNLDLYDPNGSAKTAVPPTAKAAGGWETPGIPGAAAIASNPRYRAYSAVVAASPMARPPLVAGNPPQLGPQMQPQLGDRMKPRSTPAPRPLQQPGFDFRLPERMQPLPENKASASRYRVA